MRYLPQTTEEIQKMCEKIGVEKTSDLFSSIPDSLKLDRPLSLPKALSEQEMIRDLFAISRQNKTVSDTLSFLGAGAYHHYIPSAVSALVGRGEFTTSYTPYQPEISQGTLQAIFEFQTMVASLLGLEIANASTYDGASAFSEAVLMASRIRQGRRVIVARSVHPDYRRVLQAVMKSLDIEIIEMGCDQTGRVNLEELRVLLSSKQDPTVAVCVQSPNFFGVVEDLTALSTEAHLENALFISVTTEAIAFGLFKSPGACGADIAVSEGQSFGNALNFGGPYLGLFAAKKEFLRQLPGRIVGETVDQKGDRGFVLTFNTREQHIRREKATSNICTNQSLCALSAAVYLSLMGPKGLKRLGQINLSKAEYAKKRLLEQRGVKLAFNGATFNEFVIQTEKPAKALLDHLLRKNIFAGIDVGSFYPELENAILICVTEMLSKEAIDRFVTEMHDYLKTGDER